MHSSGEKQATKAREDIVQIIVYATLVYNVEAPREFFFDKVLFQSLKPFISNAVIIAQVRHETHQEVDLVHGDSKLGLCNEAAIDTRVYLNYFGNLVLTRCKVIPRHLTLPETKERVLFDRVRHLSLRALHDHSLEGTADNEVKVIGHLSLLIEGFTAR